MDIDAQGALLYSAPTSFEWHGFPHAMTPLFVVESDTAVTSRKSR
jgi:hypothetical protein